MTSDDLTICVTSDDLTRLSILTLIVEAVNSVDTGALVVAPEQEKVLWVLYFVGQ